MAKMKAEFMHGYHQKHGVSKKEEFFGNPGKHYPLAARFSSLVNMVAKSQIGKQVLRQLFGVSPLRDLPEFSSSVLGIGSEEILLQPLIIKSFYWPIYLLIIMTQWLENMRFGSWNPWALKLCSQRYRN